MSAVLVGATDKDKVKVKVLEGTTVKDKDTVKLKVKVLGGTPVKDSGIFGAKVGFKRSVGRSTVLDGWGFRPKLL